MGTLIPRRLLPALSTLLTAVAVAGTLDSHVAFALQTGAPPQSPAPTANLIPLQGKIIPHYLKMEEFCGVDGTLVELLVQQPDAYIAPGVILGFTKPRKKISHEALHERFSKRLRDALEREFLNFNLEHPERRRRLAAFDEAMEQAKKTRRYPFFALRDGTLANAPAKIGELLELANPFGDPTLNNFIRSASFCRLEAVVPEEKRKTIASLFHRSPRFIRQTEVQLTIRAGHGIEIKDTANWLQFSQSTFLGDLKVEALLPLHDFFEADLRKEYPCTFVIEDRAPPELRKRAMRVAELWERVDDDDLVAMVSLAKCLQTGLAGEPDPYKAIELLETAADSGNARAIYELSLIYREGIWLSQDIAKADQLLQQAANAGSLAAKMELEK